MTALLIIAASDPDDAAWARWLNDVMSSWPGQLVILLMFTGLAALLVRHAAREWEHGVHNRYLQVGLLVAGVFFVLQFLLAGSLVGDGAWPVWLFYIEFVGLFALWLYAFVRFLTRQRSGPGDEASRERGRALDRALAEASEEHDRIPASR